MKEKLQIYALLAEVFSAVAVIITLIILIIDLRENTSELKSVNTSLAVGRFNEDYRTLIAEDAELARIFGEGLNDRNKLNDLEKRRFDAVCENIIWALVEAYERLGTLEDKTRINGPINTALAFMEGPGFRDCWAIHRRYVIDWGYESFIKDIENR